MTAPITLYPFQKTGVEFLADPTYDSKLLADDMGLGKTVQVIAALDKINAERIVVVCPATVKIHWARSIVKFSTHSRSVFIVRTKRDVIPPDAQVIILNYEMVLADRINIQLVTRSKVLGFDAVVMDEAHYLKNPEAKRTQRLLRKGSFVQNADRKWALTGTPILNRPIEIYPILYALAKHVIEPYLSWRSFAEHFCNGHDDVKCARCGAFWPKNSTTCRQCGAKSYSQYGFNDRGSSNSDELAERLKVFMLRRRKEDVISDLPGKVETVVELDCDAPCGLDDEFMATVRRELALAKIPTASSYVATLLSEVDKVVIFAHHREAILQLQSTMAQYRPVRLFGGMTAEAKQKSIDAFIEDPAVRILVAQTVAGGTGVDGLQGVCSYAVFLEPDWSPGIMDQAVDRLRRIGQRDTVFVHYLVVPNSLDTVMNTVLKAKRDVINRIVKEVNMSLEATLERIAVAVERIAVVMEERLVVATTSTATAKARSTKPKATDAVVATATEAEPEAAAPVKEAEVKASPEVGSNLTDADVRAAAVNFITSTPDHETNKRIVNEVIWPSFGATKLDDLDEKHYPAAMEAFGKGVAAFNLPLQNDDKSFEI